MKWYLMKLFWNLLLKLHSDYSTSIFHYWTKTGNKLAATHPSLLIINDYNKWYIINDYNVTFSKTLCWFDCKPEPFLQNELVFGSSWSARYRRNNTEPFWRIRGMYSQTLRLSGGIVKTLSISFLSVHLNLFLFLKTC